VEDSQALNAYSRYNFSPSEDKTQVTPKKVAFSPSSTPSWLPLDYFASVFQQPARLGSQLLKTNISALFKLASENSKQSSPVGLPAELQARLSPPKLNSTSQFKPEPSTLPARVQPIRSELPARQASPVPLQTFVSSTPVPARLRSFFEQPTLEQINRVENVSSVEKAKASSAYRGSPATQFRTENTTSSPQNTFTQQSRDFSAADYYQQARAFAAADKKARFSQLTQGISTQTAGKPSSSVSNASPRPDVPLTFVPIFDAPSYRSTQSPNPSPAPVQSYFRPIDRPELEYITLQLPNKKQSYSQFRPSISTSKPLSDPDNFKPFSRGSSTLGPVQEKVSSPPTTSTTTSTTTTTTTTTARTPSTTSLSFEQFYYGSEEYADDYLEDDYEILQTDNGTESSSSRPDRVPSSTSRSSTTRTTESSVRVNKVSNTASISEAQTIRKSPSFSSEHASPHSGRGRPIRFETLEIPLRDSYAVPKPEVKSESSLISTAAPTRSTVRSTTEALKPFTSSTPYSVSLSDKEVASVEVKIRGTPKSILISRDSLLQPHRAKISDSTIRNTELHETESTTAKSFPVTTYRSRKRIAPKSRPSGGSHNSEENETGFSAPHHARRLRPSSQPSKDSSAENESVQRQAKRTRPVTSRTSGSDEEQSDGSPENLVPVQRTKADYSGVSAAGDEGYRSEVEDDVPHSRKTSVVEAVDQPTTFRSRSRAPLPSRSRVSSLETLNSPASKYRRVTSLRNVTIDPPPTTYSPRTPFKVTTSSPVGLLQSSTSFENEVTPGDDSDASKASLPFPIPLFRATVENAADYAFTNSTLTESTLTARAQVDSDSVNGESDSTTKPILR